MTKSRGILAPRRYWTDEEIAILRQRWPDETAKELACVLNHTVLSIQQKALNLGLKKSADFLKSEKSGRLLEGHKHGEKSRFQKGNVPANKGKKGVSHPNMVPTQFKKGVKPYNALPIGNERINSSGYRQRKMTDTGYPPRDWVFVHHLVWEAAGNKIPKGYALTFRDGNKQNITLENLELVSHADWMRRHSVHNYGKEIAQVMQLRGAVKRQLNKRRENHV